MRSRLGRGGAIPKSARLSLPPTTSLGPMNKNVTLGGNGEKEINGKQQGPKVSQMGSKEKKKKGQTKNIETDTETEYRTELELEVGFEQRRTEEMVNPEPPPTKMEMN